MWMVRQRTGWRVAIVLAVLVAAMAWVGAVVVSAQGGQTPDDDGVHGEMDGPRPAVIEGDAKWAIDERTFEADFPAGMWFTLVAASDQGEITSARVTWQHSPGSGTVRSASASFNPDTGRWEAAWNPTSNQVPPWVLVRYRWELADAQGNRYLTAEIDEQYEDPDTVNEWGHLESEDVVVYWLGLPDEFGQMTIEAMAERREFYRQAWGGLLPYRPRVVLYGWSAMAEYEEVLGGPAIVGNALTAGTTDSDWGGTVQIAQPTSGAYNTTYGTVVHEVAHLYQEQFTRLTVDWFIEGNAEFFMMNRGDGYRDYARRRLSSGDPLSLEIGFSIRGTQFQDGYWIGAVFWDYFVETYGLDAHRELWDLIGSNVPRYEALQTVTGISLDQLEREWRAWLGVTTVPPTLAPSPTPPIDIFAFPTPTFAAPGAG